MCPRTQNGPQMWLDDGPAHPYPVFLFRSKTVTVCCVPAPSEGPKGIWRKNPLGSFLVTMGPENCQWQKGGVSLNLSQLYRAPCSYPHLGPCSRLVCDAAPCWPQEVRQPCSIQLQWAQPRAGRRPAFPHGHTLATLG